MDAKFAEEIAPLLLRGVLRMSSPSASMGSIHTLRWRECKLVLKPKELEQAARGTEPRATGGPESPPRRRQSSSFFSTGTAEPRHRPARHRDPCCCRVESGYPLDSRRSKPCWRRSARRSTACSSSAEAQRALGWRSSSPWGRAVPPIMPCRQQSMTAAFGCIPRSPRIAFTSARRIPLSSSAGCMH